MASIKMAYIGGGSSRAPGTMASFFAKGDEFDGSEVVLIDRDPEHLELVRQLAQNLADEAGRDIKVTTTTDQRAGVEDADAVLTSFRPGNFAARALDERIPIKHGVIGQETQGPGGLMMALRSTHFFQGIVDDIQAVAPHARIFNYTNPVNVVSQAVTMYTDAPIVSFCEGGYLFPARIAKEAGLDPELMDATMVGVNHNVWSLQATYDGRDAIEVLTERYHELTSQGVPAHELRQVKLAVTMGAIPSEYFKYYYYGDEILREQRSDRRTRSEHILDELPSYWEHYKEQAASAHPSLDPSRSRGGIHELELALDAISAYFNDTGRRLVMNVPNTDNYLPGFDRDVVVEVWGTVDRVGFHPEHHGPLPHAVRGLVQQLAEYQYLAAVAGWEGTRKDAIRAMVAHPFVPSLRVAEELYDELSYAHRQWLPERLLA